MCFCVSRRIECDMSTFSPQTKIIEHEPLNPHPRFVDKSGSISLHAGATNSSEYGYLSTRLTSSESRAVRSCVSYLPITDKS